MKIPSEIFNQKEWTLVGPMGPILEDIKLLSLPLMIVDGGANFCSKGLVWVGDSDSSTFKIHADHFVELSPKKDFSDLEAAYNLFPLDSSFTLHLWGFLGGRDDHQLINLGETYKMLKARPNSSAYFYRENGDLGMILTSKEDYKFTHQGLFSLICFETSQVQLTGECEFQLKDGAMVDLISSQGLSNQGFGEITVKGNNPVLIVLGVQK